MAEADVIKDDTLNDLSVPTTPKARPSKKARKKLREALGDGSVPARLSGGSGEAGPAKLGGPRNTQNPTYRDVAAKPAPKPKGGGRGPKSTGLVVLKPLSKSKKAVKRSGQGQGGEQSSGTGATVAPGPGSSVSGPPAHLPEGDEAGGKRNSESDSAQPVATEGLVNAGGAGSSGDTGTLPAVKKEKELDNSQAFELWCAKQLALRSEYQTVWKDLPDETLLDNYRRRYDSLDHATVQALLESHAEFAQALTDQAKTSAAEAAKLVSQVAETDDSERLTPAKENQEKVKAHLIRTKKFASNLRKRSAAHSKKRASEYNSEVQAASARRAERTRKASEALASGGIGPEGSNVKQENTDDGPVRKKQKSNPNKAKQGSTMTVDTQVSAAYWRLLGALGGTPSPTKADLLQLKNVLDGLIAGPNRVFSSVVQSGGNTFFAAPQSAKGLGKSGASETGNTSGTRGQKGGKTKVKQESELNRGKVSAPAEGDRAELRSITVKEAREVFAKNSTPAEMMKWLGSYACGKAVIARLIKTRLQYQYESVSRVIDKYGEWMDASKSSEGRKIALGHLPNMRALTVLIAKFVDKQIKEDQTKRQENMVCLGIEDWAKRIGPGYKTFQDELVKQTLACQTELAMEIRGFDSAADADMNVASALAQPN
jgi:hypothetical protein